MGVLHFSKGEILNRFSDGGCSKIAFGGNLRLCLMGPARHSDMSGDEFDKVENFLKKMWQNGECDSGLEGGGAKNEQRSCGEDVGIREGGMWFLQFYNLGS
ncbi:hypothetical protein QQ045_020116 [Rhodiola kirilowii]